MESPKAHKKTSRADWHKARIVYELRLVGWTLRRLSAAHGFHPDAVRKAMHLPYPGAEAIIASALNLEPWVIWPSRYDHYHQPIRRRDLRRNRAGPKHSALPESDNGKVVREV